MPLSCPQGIQPTASQSAGTPGGKAITFFLWLQERLLVQKEGIPLLAKSSKISRIITSGVLK